MALVDPVILIPGITAVYLKDQYPLPPEYVWTVLRKEYERVALHPNDLRYEVEEPSRLKPDQLYEIAYKEIVEELRYNLRSREDQPVPVYPFGYDWRMRLDDIQDQLDDFIEEVIDRTKILRHYHQAGYSQNPKVNLVGHSMGGLIITGYLRKKGESSPVNKVVTLAAPYQGSFEAVLKITTGTADLGTSPPSSREREAARITPALYHLLPSFKNGIETDPGIPDSLFQTEAWQPGIVETIKEWVRLKGLPIEPPMQLAEKIFAKLLADGKQHREGIDRFKLADAGLTSERWLAVVGVDSVTRVHLKIIKRGKSPQFFLQSSDRQNNWDPKDHTKEERRFTGDGTVPFEGAVPKFLKEENLVCVSPDDYGYWELEDKALSKIGGFHGILPNMNMIHRLIVRFFSDKPDKHGNTWGRRAPGVVDWNPPLKLNEKT